MFYQNNQFINSKFNQCFFLQKTYDQFSSNKCFYCYKNDHVFKRMCSKFNDDFFSNRIHIFDKIFFLKFLREKTFYVPMYANRNQCECVKNCEKFNENCFFAAFVSAFFAFSAAIFQIMIFVVSKSVFKKTAFVFENVNIIIIEIEIVQKFFIYKKNESEIVMLNHINMNVVVLFTTATRWNGVG